MKQMIFFVSLCFFSTLLHAQLQDSFEDGNFNANPTWTGNENLFIVNNEILQLNATSEDTAFLSVPVNIADSTSWSFWVNLDFAPSATGNFLKIYLSSDNSDLKAPLNGYFLRVGETNTDDAFELYRQDGSDEVFIYRFNTEGEMGSSSDNTARVHITRNNDGLWRFEADYMNNGCFVDEGSILEDSYPMGSYFGFFCRYTSGNSTDFFFDDIYIDLPNPSLSLNSLTVINLSDIQLLFSKQLDPVSAETTGNYLIKDALGANIGNPISAFVDNGNLIHLDISNLTITSGEDYTVEVSNVLDCNGALIGSNNSLPFQVFITEPPVAFDILINEIFEIPDPDLTNLPDAEFVELYNRSDKVINLEGFQFSDNGLPKILTSYILEPGGYLILCDSDDTALFSPFGNVLGIDGFPGLNNGGDNLSLLDASGNIIHQAFYNSDWYQNEDKDGGGWTLELINPELYCHGELNWRASNNPDGGTPGQQNSIFNDTPDTNGPQLLDASALNDHQLRLTFNEIMADALTPSSFQLSGNTGIVINTLLEGPDNTSILIDISAPFFQDNTNYTLTLDTEVRDCSGNSVSAEFNSVEFTYYEAEPAEAYDILINEIFADPTPSFGLPEAEYIELYNRSDKNINLDNFILADGSANSDDVILPNYLLQAGTYLILYKKDSGSYSAYGDTLVLNSFVNLVNTGNDLILFNPEDDVIHAVNYTDDWYQDSEKSEGGWSLELINPNKPCDVNTNWRASVNPTGGTPGLPNSILETEIEESPLDLICAFPVSPTQVRLFFNKAVDPNAFSDLFEMDGFDISSIELEEPLFNMVLIDINPPMEADQIYRVNINTNLTDCIGNEVGMFNEVPIALPETIEAFDIVLNEVLFNPQTNGVDFVELYNRSNKVLDISELFIATRDEEENIDSPKEIRSECLLFPTDYIVLTPDPFDIRNRYTETDIYAFSEMNLPTYPEKEGDVVLYAPQLLGALVIDEFQYMESMHYPLLNNKKGVSLERINPNSVTQSEDNWHSAAEDVGFATPTYQNSQFISGNLATDDRFFWLDNNRLSPDNDGFEDFLQVNYALDQPGYTANLRIYDAKGRLIKIITDNELLLTEGVIKWDGVNEDGNRARTGIHILDATLLHPNGDLKHYKKAFVVASKLD